MQQNQKLVKISRKSLIVDVISSCLAISSLFIPLFSFGGLDSENLFKFLTDFFKGLSGNGVLTRWHFVFMLTALLIFIGAMMSFIDLFRMLVKSGKAPTAPKLNSTAHFIFALIAFIVCVVYVLTRDKLTIALLLFFGKSRVWILPCLHIIPMCFATHYHNAYKKELESGSDN